MAFFGVTKETIKEVKPHSNADRLEIASLVGMNFQFVVPKGQYADGQEVVYFPVDSLIPADVLEKLGLIGKLSGKEKNRVKTIRLRGEISQGIVADPDTVGVNTELDNESITEALGVTKYDPPAIPMQSGNLVALPMGLSPYDIEGADRYSDVAEKLMDQVVSVTEKIEGSNFSIAYDPGSGKVIVNQRRYSIEEIEGSEHMFWTLARQSGLYTAMMNWGWASHNAIVLYGEFIGPGVQGNMYGLKRHMVTLFDAKINGSWQSVEAFREIGTWLDLAPGGHEIVHFAPELNPDGKTLREWLDGKTIQEASDGYSTFHARLPESDVVGPVRREGIVIKPMQPDHDMTIGRLILKQRGPEYLAKSEL